MLAGDSRRHKPAMASLTSTSAKRPGFETEKERYVGFFSLDLRVPTIPYLGEPDQQSTAWRYNPPPTPLGFLTDTTAFVATPACQRAYRRLQVKKADAP
jgi:hypothetical protein